MPDPDLDQLRVFNPDEEPDPEEDLSPDPTEEVGEYEEAEQYGGSGIRSQGYYGNPNDGDNQGTIAKDDQSVPSGHVGVPSADDDPMASAHPIEDRSDAEIRDDIAAYFKQHDEADTSSIDYEVTAGSVVLTGEADKRTIELAEMQVRGVAGVKEVRSEVKVVGGEFPRARI